VSQTAIDLSRKTRQAYRLIENLERGLWYPSLFHGVSDMNHSMLSSLLFGALHYQELQVRLLLHRLNLKSDHSHCLFLSTEELSIQLRLF